MTRNTIIGSVWETNQFVKPLEYTNMAFDRPILQLILEKDSKSDFLIGRPWANSRRKFQSDRSRDKPDTLQAIPYVGVFVCCR